MCAQRPLMRPLCNARRTLPSAVADGNPSARSHRILASAEQRPPRRKRAPGRARLFGTASGASQPNPSRGQSLARLRLRPGLRRRPASGTVSKTVEFPDFNRRLVRKSQGIYGPTQSGYESTLAPARTAGEGDLQAPRQRSGDRGESERQLLLEKPPRNNGRDRRSTGRVHEFRARLGPAAPLRKARSGATS